MAKIHHYYDKRYIKNFLKEERKELNENYRKLLNFITSINVGDLLFYKGLLFQIIEFRRKVSDEPNRVIFQLVCSTTKPVDPNDLEESTASFSLDPIRRQFNSPLFCGYWVNINSITEFKPVPHSDLPLYMGCSYKSSLFIFLLKSCGQIPKSKI